jgi:hypothetical protein
MKQIKKKLKILQILINLIIILNVLKVIIFQLQKNLFHQI